MNAPQCDLSLHISIYTLGNCFYGDCPVSWSYGATINVGLVSLTLLGWELHVSYITVLCVQGIPIFSPLIFMPPYYIPIPFSYLSPLILVTILNLLIILLQVSSNATSSKKYYVVGSLDYLCTCMYIRGEMTGCIGNTTLYINCAQ